MFYLASLKLSEVEGVWLKRSPISLEYLWTIFASSDLSNSGAAHLIVIIPGLYIPLQEVKDITAYHVVSLLKYGRTSNVTTRSNLEFRGGFSAMCVIIKLREGMILYGTEMQSMSVLSWFCHYWMT